LSIMRLTFLGAARQVTGSCYLLETSAGQVMVDCGMFQGSMHMRTQNRVDRCFDPAQVRWLLLTHSHLDHCGLIPRLVDSGFKGQIVCTSATADMCEVVLNDSAHLQVEDAKFDLRRWKKSGRVGPPPEPLYNHEDVAAALRLFRTVPYDRMVRLAKGLQVRFRDAGHILGSATIELHVGNPPTVIVFSGDIGYPGRPILKDPVIPERADFVVMESTYGDREHETVGEAVEQLKRIVVQTSKAGGALLIPTFATGRAQEILYELGHMRRSGLLGDIPVFLDSPMAIEATAVVRRHPECFDAQIRRLIESGKMPFRFRGVRFLRTPRQSQVLNDLATPFIVLAGSGMCTGGRIRHHLLHHLQRRQDAVLLVGFQAAGTLGRLLKDGAKQVYIFGQPREVKARIEALDGFSAHADRNQLLEWLRPMRNTVRRVFLTHGEPQACVALAAAIRRRYKLPVMVPDMNDTVDLTQEQAMTRLARIRGRDAALEAAAASNFGTA